MDKLSRNQINILFGEKLDSTIFTWLNYCGTRGVSVIHIFNNDNGLFNVRFDCRGWCFSDSLLSGFSKSSGIAVMLWDNEKLEDVWCHISDEFQITLFRGFNLRTGK
ncbi:MAG: hypothetical protein WC428_01965 [Candidatus Paceibacterota bacterium]